MQRDAAFFLNDNNRLRNEYIFLQYVIWMIY